MSAVMSDTNREPSGYYQWHRAPDTSQSRAMTTQAALPDERAILARVDQKALVETRQQVSDLARLPEGWNGYGALPPTSDVVFRAMHWLNRSFKECQDAHVRWYKPKVSASAEGGVAFEWWDRNHSLIVYVDAEEIEYHKSQDGDGPTEHTHGDASLGQQQAELLRWFGEQSGI